MEGLQKSRTHNAAHSKEPQCNHQLAPCLEGADVHRHSGKGSERQECWGRRLGRMEAQISFQTSVCVGIVWGEVEQYIDAMQCTEL